MNPVVGNPAPASRGLRGWELVVPLSLCVGVLALRSSPVSGLLSTVAWTLSVLAAFWAAIPGRATGACLAGPTRSSDIVGLGHVLALLLAVAAAMLQTVFLLTRAILVLVDLWNGFPGGIAQTFAFEANGVWTQTMLFAACAGGLLATGDHRLITCLLWCTASLAVWASLASPVVYFTSTGAIQRGGSTAMLLVCLAVLLSVCGVVGTVFSRGRADCVDRGPSTPARAGPPGFHSSCAVLGLGLLFCVAYHLAVPVAVIPAHPELGPVAAFLSSLAGGLSCICLGLSARRDALVDVGLALIGLACAALPTCFVATSRKPLAEAMPVHFNAMLIGSASAIAGATWLMLRVRMAAAGQPQGSWRRWILPRLRRCTFMLATLALVFATMMTAWPRLPAISAMDDSLPRVAMGFLSGVLLTVTTTYSAMRLGGWSFHAVSVLSLVATVGFLWSRMLPFSP